MTGRAGVWGGAGSDQCVLYVHRDTTSWLCKVSDANKNELSKTRDEGVSGMEGGSCASTRTRV